MPFRLLPVVLIAMCAPAWQDATHVFEKAPEGVEQALRERVATFYQAHVDGRFRQAEQVIAEDSKDLFYEMNKQRYHGFEIVKIVYSDNHSKASVMVAADMDFRSPRIGLKRVKAPLTSTWKLENGEWWWYTVPVTERMTPFGMMGIGSDVGAASPAPPARSPVDVAAVKSGVRPNKKSVRLSGYEASSGSIAFTNTMPGQVQLDLVFHQMQGLKAKLDKNVIGANETAVLNLSYSPPNRNPKSPINIQVTIRPTNQSFPIRVEFTDAPEWHKPSAAVQPQ